MKLDLKVGDYVRTKYGISKIEKIEDDKTHKTTWYTVDKAQYHSFLVREQEIIKASDKLIDLIEVGDYVNDYYVSKIWEENEIMYYIDKTPVKRKERQITIQAPSYGGIIHLKNEEIKSIVTKEQMEQMSYKIGD